MPQFLIWAIPFLLAYFIFKFPHLQLPLKSLLFIEERDLTETVEKYISPIRSFERSAVRNRVVGHSIGEYGSVYCYGL